MSRKKETYQKADKPLSPGVTLALPHADAAASGLALTVADLTRWAQSGDTADWGGPEGAEDALLEVGEALWSRPIDAGSDGWTVGDLRAALADDDPHDPVRLAVGCAVARWLIASGQPVTTGELAALASVTVGRGRRGGRSRRHRPRAGAAVEHRVPPVRALAAVALDAGGALGLLCVERERRERAGAGVAPERVQQPPAARRSVRRDLGVARGDGAPLDDRPQRVAVGE